MSPSSHLLLLILLLLLPQNVTRTFNVAMQFKGRQFVFLNPSNTHFTAAIVEGTNLGTVVGSEVPALWVGEIPACRVKKTGNTIVRHCP